MPSPSSLAPSDEPPPFSPQAAQWMRGAIFLFIAGLVFAGVAWFLYADSHADTPSQLYIDQPVMFSHQHHVDLLGIDCRFCHTSVEETATAGMPDTQTCMTCHSQLFRDSPMLAPIRKSQETGQPMRWNRVHDLKDVVYFDHSIHVNKGVACAECHGDIAKMPLVARVQPLTMGWCLDCHREPEGRLVPPEEVIPSPPLLADPLDAPPPEDNAGNALLSYYHISPYNLTDCSTCHH